MFDVLVIFCPRGGGTDTQHIPIPPYPKNNAKRSDFHRDLLQRLRLFRRYGKIKRTRALIKKPIIWAFKAPHIV